MHVNEKRKKKEKLGPWGHCLILLLFHYLLIYASGNTKFDTRANLTQLILSEGKDRYTHLPTVALMGITSFLPTGRVPTSHSALLAQDLTTAKYFMRSRF